MPRYSVGLRANCLFETSPVFMPAPRRASSVGIVSGKRRSILRSSPRNFSRYSASQSSRNSPQYIFQLSIIVSPIAAMTVSRGTGRSPLSFANSFVQWAMPQLLSTSVMSKSKSAAFISLILPLP